jgi:hypothetical protein
MFLYNSIYIKGIEKKMNQNETITEQQNIKTLSTPVLNTMDILLKKLKVGKKVYALTLGKDFSSSNITELKTEWAKDDVVKFTIVGGFSRGMIHIADDKSASMVFFKYVDAFETLKNKFNI